mgnify:CR=1 FL=1
MAQHFFVYGSLLEGAGTKIFTSDEEAVGFLVRLGECGGDVTPERARELLAERRAYSPEMGDMCVAACPNLFLSLA